MTRKPIEFPVRLSGWDKVEVIRLPKPMGGSAKIYLRNIAKEMSEYHQPIVTGISGRTDSGEEIPINTLGRWFFGTPGYMGHVRVMNWEGADAKVEWPSQSPDIVQLFVVRLKERVEAQLAGNENVLEQAMQLIEKRKPKASPQKKAAFANSVQYLVTGSSGGGYGGPSVREHAATRMYGGERLFFEKAVKHLLANNGPIFGPLTDLHRCCWEEEHCFDDDPRDIEELTS